jgi:pyrimidine operon attenuation protein / uracil phosphoribosyltransferase
LSLLPALPDPEKLLATLVEKLRARANADLGIIGIRTGGVWVAEHLHQALGLTLPMGTIDVSFYRDDYGRVGLHPGVKPSDIPFKVENRNLLLVDDVLYTGRTVRAAINEIFDYGRPGTLWLAALVDRGGRQLPIAADAVGAVLDIPANQRVELLRAPDGKLTLEYQAAGA